MQLQPFLLGIPKSETTIYPLLWIDGPDPPMIWRLRSFRDFTDHYFMTFELSSRCSPNPELRNTEILEPPKSTVHAPPDLIAQIMSEFRISRVHWTLTSDFPIVVIAMALGSTTTCPLRWRVLILSRNVLSWFFTSLHLRSLGAKNVDGFRIFSACHSRSNDWSDFVISRFHISGYWVQSPLLIQLPILNFPKASDQRFMIFLDPIAQIESCFRDSWIVTIVFSNLYSLRFSQMPRSRHVSSLTDGPNNFKILRLRKSTFLLYAPED